MNNDDGSAFCAVDREGHCFYGRTEREAMGALLSKAAESCRMMARLGRCYLPTGVMSNLPALPDGYEYLVVERSYVDEDAGAGVPYEWRTFAVPQLAGEDVSAPVAWRSGKPTTFLQQSGRWVNGTVGRGPAVLHHLDEEYCCDEVSLPPRSLEFANGSWVERKTVDLPLRGFRGHAFPPLPARYGLVILTIEDDKGLEHGCLAAAMPFGTHSLWTGGTAYGPTVIVVDPGQKQPVRARQYDPRDHAPFLPETTLVLRDNAWAHVGPAAPEDDSVRYAPNPQWDRFVPKAHGLLTVGFYGGAPCDDLPAIRRFSVPLGATVTARRYRGSETFEVGSTPALLRHHRDCAVRLELPAGSMELLADEWWVPREAANYPGNDN